MRTLTLLLALLLLLYAPSAAQEARSRLSPSRCTPPTTGDSLASIRVILDPPQAYTKSLSLVATQVGRDGSDSISVQPPFGVDSLARLAPGLYRLKVRQIGYYPPRDTLRIGRGEAWCVVAHMVRDTVQLRPTY
jgi:hypothetical protein